jgi:hypothetical protein
VTHIHPLKVRNNRSLLQVRYDDQGLSKRETFEMLHDWQILSIAARKQLFRSVRITPGTLSRSGPASSVECGSESNPCNHRKAGTPTSIVSLPDG